MLGEIHVLTGLGVVAPHVACHTRGVMLAQGVFHTLLVLIYKEFAVAVKSDFLGRRSNNLSAYAAFNRHLIHLGQT